MKFLTNTRIIGIDTLITDLSKIEAIYKDIGIKFKFVAHLGDLSKQVTTVLVLFKKKLI